MRTCLAIIDMQNGFKNGVTDYLPEKIVNFVNTHNFDSVVATRYINSTETACYKFEGWKECMAESTDAELVDCIKDVVTKVFDKGKYSCWNTEFKQYLKDNNIDKVYFVGVNTGCCVLHSVFDCYNDVFECTVVSDLCGSTSGINSHIIALQVLRECITSERVVHSKDVTL